MIKKILDTYECLISCREKLPGMKLEDAFNAEAFNEVREEYKWLLKHASDARDRMLNKE